MKRLLSLFLCAVMCFGCVPSEALAAYIPKAEVEEAIGEIDGVPILSEDDAARLFEEQEAFANSFPETDEDFVNLLLSDSEEANTFFSGTDEADEFGDYIGAAYWSHIPQYEPMVKDKYDGTIHSVSPDEYGDHIWSEYVIVMEDESVLQLYRYEPYNGVVTKLYYLYCLYKTNRYETQKAYSLGAETALAYDFVYFYTTLPYRDDNVQGFTWKMPHYAENGLPIPKTICDPRGMRAYTRDEMCNGGTVEVTEGHSVKFDGMGSLWFHSGGGTDFEKNYEGYENPNKFLFARESDGSKNRRLKNVVTVSLFDRSFGVNTENVSKEMGNINPKGGTVRNATIWDPGAFVQLGSTYYSTRQNISGLIRDKIVASNRGQFTNDTYFNNSNGGFYDVSVMQWKPWNANRPGELGSKGYTKFAMYKGTLNSKIVTPEKTTATNNLTSEDIRFDGLGLLNTIYLAGGIKFLTITKDMGEDLYKGFIEKAGGAENLDSWINTTYGTRYSKDKIKEEKTIIYLDKDSVAANEANGITEKTAEGIRKTIDGFYGIVYAFEATYGQKFGASHYDKSQTYLPTGEYQELNDGTFHALLTGNRNCNICNLNLTLPDDWKLTDYSGSAKSWDKYSFFACPLFCNVKRLDSLKGWTTEAKDALYAANTFGKFLMIMLYFSVDNNMTDPTSPLFEDGKFPITGTAVVTKNDGIYYNTIGLPRAFVEAGVGTYDLPTVEKDLVVSGTEDNTVYEALGGSKDDDERKYLDSCLWAVRNDDEVSPERFKEIVGVSKETFNSYASSMNSTTDATEAATWKNDYNYGGSNLKNLGRDDFLECFKPLLENDYLEAGKTIPLRHRSETGVLPQGVARFFRCMRSSVKAETK